MTDQVSEFQRGKITETPGGQLKADEAIIKSVATARQIYQRYRQNHLKRIALAKEIEGLIQGNPPYNPADIAALGLPYLSNFNDMSPRSLIKRASLSYWNLVYNAQYLTRFVIRSAQKDSKIAYYQETLARHWDFAVYEHWPEFLVNLAFLQTQIVRFGLSPAFFHDEKDPRWRVIDYSRFFVPDQASVDLNLLTSFCVESEFTVQYLWQVYKEFHGKKDPPWNTKELGKLLLRLADTKAKTDTMNELEVGRRLFSGDLNIDQLFTDIVRVVSLLQKEYDGKISHYMFHRDFSASGQNGETLAEQFLFYEKGQYDKVNRALVLFTMNPGEPNIHSNRGVGHEIFSLGQAKIQTDCSVIDMTKWASTPMIKGSALGTKDPQQIRWAPGVPTNLGSAEFVENTMGANLQAVMGASGFLRESMEHNIAYSGSDPAQPDPDVGSASPLQTRLQAYREFSVQKNHVAHFLRTMDILYGNMTRIMFYSKEGDPGHEIAETWIRRSLEDGVPEEVFSKEAKRTKNGMPHHLECYATRVLGAGSQVAQLLGLEELKPLVPSLNVDQQKAYTRMLVSSALGPEQLDTFDVDANEMDERGGGASLAAVENAIMQMGKAPVFSNDNEHRAHFSTHLALAKHIIDSVVQQQVDPVEADTIFNALVPHLGEHLKALSTNIFAQTFFDKAKGAFDQVQRYAQLNRKNAAKILQAKAKQQQEAQANQQRVMTEEELKTQQVVADEKRKDIKLIAQANRQKEAGDKKAEILERKTDAELAIKRRKAEGETQIKAVSKQSESAINEPLAEARQNPAQYLEKMGGETPSPFDIEGGKTPTV